MNRSFLAGCVLTATLAPLAAAQPCSPQWTAPDPLGCNNNVNAMAVSSVGGQALVLGGDFTTVGGVSASRMARWNGQSWSTMGSGVSNGSVNALTTFDDGTGPAIYAGGSFLVAGGNPANHVARWNGSAWSPVGAGFNDNVYSFCVYNDGTGPALYAGGGFVTPFGTRGFISKWTGSSWVTVGGGVNSAVYAMTVFNDGTGDAMYIGGSFTSAGTTQVNRIAKWDGSQWSALATGVDDYIQALTVYTDAGAPTLAAAGGFTTAGGQPAARVARWTGDAWSPMGSGFTGTHRALAVFDDGSGSTLYTAGGSFGSPFGAGSGFVFKWDGLAWQSLGTTGDNPVLALGVYNDGRSALFAGGQFTTLGGLSATRFARWGCPPAPPCGSPDFNCDGDVGTDADIEAFFACLAGNCPAAPCTNSADFNGDGDIGTDADIEAFFRVLAGGTC